MSQMSKSLDNVYYLIPNMYLIPILGCLMIVPCVAYPAFYYYAIENMFLFSCLVVACTLHYAMRSVNVQINRRGYSSIPHAPLDGVFSGHVTTVRKAKDENRFLDLWMEWTEKYGSTVVFHMTDRSFILTIDPVILKELSTDVATYCKAPALPNRALYGQTIVGTNSILSGNGLSWAIKRKLMAQFFAKSNMTELFSVCEPHMKTQEVRRWTEVAHKGNHIINLHEQLAITLASYLQVLGFGNFLTPTIIASNVEKILDAIPKQKLIGDKGYQFSAERQAVIGMVKHMRGEAIQVIQARYQSMCNSPDEPIPHTDMLGFLIEADLNAFTTSEESLEMVVDDIMTVCVVWDNMTKQLCALFILLNDYPAVQEKMFAELREASVTTLEELNKLRYTEMCLLEAMRMSPALLRGTRTIQNEEKVKHIGPYEVRKERIAVHFSEYVMQNTSLYWKNPKIFDPERWQNNFKPEAFTYMPFYAGARGCLAKHVAMVIMKLTLSVLAKNFELKQQFDVEKPPIMCQTHAVMRILNTVHCSVTPYVT